MLANLAQMVSLFLFSVLLYLTQIPLVYVYGIVAFSAFSLS